VSGPEREYDVIVTDLHKRFEENHVLRGLSLKVRRGETYVLLGPSGTGKSIFLKHIAALVRPDAGTIEVLGKRLGDLSGEELLAHRRRVGMVFQGAALLASLTVEENVGLALAEHKAHRPEKIKEIVNAKLAQVGLEGTNDLLPEELSGGMKKRVAVARTLALQPEIILFDEPTTGLDPVTATDVDDLIVDLKERLKITSIVVSHDLTGAFKVGDRLAMLSEGAIVEEGAPDAFKASDNDMVRSFIERDLRGAQL
jgi:phospholipid/cholesterol/gamma-HCH transport system ATP-binding protein